MHVHYSFPNLVFVDFYWILLVIVGFETQDVLVFTALTLVYLGILDIYASKLNSLVIILKILIINPRMRLLLFVHRHFHFDSLQSSLSFSCFWKNLIRFLLWKLFRPMNAHLLVPRFLDLDRFLASLHLKDHFLELMIILVKLLRSCWIHLLDHHNMN